MVEFLIGADPEVFVSHRATNSFVTAHGMIEGTKDKPLPVANGAVQVDGMALEFNIDPAHNEAEFLNNISMVKKQLHQMIGVENFDLVIQPSVFFSEEVWKTTPDEAKELGCDPDFNAWQRGAANPRPDRGKDDTLRTGAGHIHIGWGSGFNIKDPDHTEACIALVKQLDASLGIASVLWDNDKDRRTLYGKAGAYRPKPYGVEYRVLSNAWLRNDELTSLVYNMATKACHDLVEGRVYVNYIGLGDVTRIINRSDRGYAEHYHNFLTGYGVPSVPKHLRVA